MRKVKYYLLLAAMVLATAIPASAQSRTEKVLTKDYGDGRAEYELVEILTAPAPANDILSQASSSSMTITNPNKPDTKAPSFKGFDLKTTTVYTNNLSKNTIKSSLKITDDYSGFNYGYVIFKNKEGRTISLYFNSFNGNKGVYESTRTVSLGEEGSYKFSYAYFYDIAGNNKWIYATDKNCSSSLKKAKFEVKFKKVDKKVTVKSPKAEKTTIKLSKNKTYDYANYSMKLTTNKGTISSADLVMQSKKGTTIKTATSGLLLSNGEWKGSQYFGNTDWYAGKWTVSQLIVRYTDGECVVLSKDNNTLTQGLKNIKITVTTKPVGESGDSKFPSVTGIKFATNKVTLPKDNGTYVDVEVKVSDKGDGVNYATVWLYDTKTGKYYSGSKNLDKPVKSGKVVVPVYINKYIATGTLKVDEVRVRNVSGNSKAYYRYYMYNTNSETYKYVDLTSDMKKLKATVKNTYKK